MIDFRKKTHPEGQVCGINEEVARLLSTTNKTHFYVLPSKARAFFISYNDSLVDLLAG